MRLIHGVIALAIGVLEAATYHIDCDLGVDSRSGTSPDAAWKSLSKVATAGLLPGDTLRLRRGCVWRGSAGMTW